MIVTLSRTVSGTAKVDNKKPWAGIRDEVLDLPLICLSDVLARHPNIRGGDTTRTIREASATALDEHIPLPRDSFLLLLSRD